MMSVGMKVWSFSTKSWPASSAGSVSGAMSSTSLTRQGGSCGSTTLRNTSPSSSLASMKMPCMEPPGCAAGWLRAGDGWARVLVCQAGCVGPRRPVAHRPARDDMRGFASGDLAVPNNEHRTALVIGASRGLGLALARELLARGWTVIGTVRGGGRTGLHESAEQSGGRLTVEPLEMTDAASRAALGERLAGRALDLLFVNAAVANGPGERIDTTSDEEFVRVMVTNALSPMRVVEALGPLVRPEGTIAVMTSSLGSVSLNTRGTWEVYRASKAALNTLMRSYAAREAAAGRTLLLVDPGWVRTEMGGADARLSIEESIPNVVDMLAVRAGTKGLAYVNYKGEEVPW
jgi:NAD(P)-dependent dehydrogenase (short-subunit alcohol dehydrogenase family)